MAPQTSTEDQQFLDELDKKLWNAAERLRSNLDAAVYKHAVLGLIFLKYVSDSFDLRREELRALFTNSGSDYYLDRENYNSEKGYEEAIEAELEDRDYFTEKNVFWVPALARWKNVQSNATLAAGTEIELKNEKVSIYKFRSVARLLDDALEEVEKENPRLKGIIQKNRYSQLQIEPSRLIGLISKVIASIPFQHASLNAKDILGHVYEYFLGQFALAEGKKGGQYYTPKSIVSLIVEMLEPHKGKVYDPAMGSGGFFVQSESFIEKYEGKIGDISVYGQESNPTTWRLAAMNMAIRGIDFNFGKQPVDTFTNDQHPDLRADFVMANPPFNDNEWWDSKLEDDMRWTYGVPPRGNANFAWLQHMIHHLSSSGSAGVVLADMALASNDQAEEGIRKRLVESDLVECIVSLPDKLFTSTPIGASIWILSKDKSSRSGYRNRKGKVLFIDARSLFSPLSRTLNDFPSHAVDQISSIFKTWRSDDNASDEEFISASVTTQTIVENRYSLFPPAYIQGESEYIDEGDLSSEELNKMATIARDADEKFSQQHSDVRPEFRMKTYRLSEILSKVSDRLGDDDEPEILTCTESAGLVLQRERFSKRVATENTSKYKVVRKSNIVYNPYLLWAGAMDQCWIVEKGITSPAYEVFEVKDGFDPTIVGMALKSKLMLSKYDGISIGTVKRRRRAPADRFLELTIDLPEQTAHASLLVTHNAIQEAMSSHRTIAREYAVYLNALSKQLLKY